MKRLLQVFLTGLLMTLSSVQVSYAGWISVEWRDKSGLYPVSGPIGVGETIRLIGTCSGYINPEWSYRGDQEIISSSVSGTELYVTGKSEGETYVIFKAYERDGNFLYERTVTCNISVWAPDPTSISLPTSQSVAKGGTLKLIPTLTPSYASKKNLTWTTSDNTVATVTSSGEVKGVSLGSAKITVKTKDNLSASCKITVVPAIQFADANVKAVCVSNWDTDGDGELSVAEATAVKSLGTVFKMRSIKSFNELRYFTELSSIYAEAFYGCSSLTSITIPESVKNIGTDAFYNCICLKKVVVPNIAAWCGITIGSLYGNPLHYAKHLFIDEETEITDLVIPDGVTSIGNQAFAGCSSLADITIPNSVTSIGEYAFYNCDSLTSITIPNSVTSIGNHAFNYCSGRTSVTVEEGNIVYDSRNNCNAIIVTATNTLITGCKNTIIPNSVTSIGSYAFHGCSSLTSITIPESVTSIGSGAFYDCFRLKKVVVPNISAWCGISFSNAYCNPLYYAKHLFIDEETEIADLVIPDDVTNIEYAAFYNCSGLTSVTIPNSVTSIGSTAFDGCSGLTSVTIPNSVTSIGSWAFYDCNNLTSIKMGSETPVNIGEYTFSNRKNATLYVPTGSKTAYANKDYWDEFNKIIEYIEGDVNVDKKVDVVDVVDIARFVVATPTISFVKILADINNDGSVNIGDAVALVNVIAGDQNFVKGWGAPSGIDANDALSLTGRDGILSLNLDNERSYTAFQFDLYVPEGADVTQMLLNVERKQQHQLLYNKVEDGHFRVTALSLSNNEFNGNDGELLNIALTGADNSEVSIRNIKFFDAKGQEYRFDDIEGAMATSLNSLTPDPSPRRGEIYNLAGQRLSKIQRGVNIVGGKKILK